MNRVVKLPCPKRRTLHPERSGNSGRAVRTRCARVPLAGKLWLIACLALLTTATSSVGGERITPERLWQLGRLGSVCLSDDGQTVAYAVRRFDLASNSGRSQVWLYDVTRRQSRELLKDLKSIDCLQLVGTGPGTRLYYIGSDAASKAKDVKSQVWYTTLDGKATVQVTDVPRGVSLMKISPDGSRIAYISRVKLDPTVQDLFADLPLADARLIDSLMYRHWNTWNDYSYSHLFVAGLQQDGRADKGRDVMRGLRAHCPLPPFGGAEEFNWSPDGKELAYTAKVVNNPAESTDSDIYLVPIMQEGPTRCITAGMNGFDKAPTYSPDGRSIAFHSMRRPGFEADKNRLMLFDRSTGTIRELSADLDQTLHQATWFPDSRSLVFMSEFRGTNRLFRIWVNDGKTVPISRGPFDWSIVRPFPGGDRLLVSSQSMLRPLELSTLTLASGEEQRVTHINDKLLASLDTPKVTQRWVRASDGKQIHCWVIYPPDFDPNKKWPLLTYCQGGPQGQISQRFSYRWNFHLMAAHGYVVVAPNRRGLPGFGRAWNDQISGDWGGQAMQDILAATDAMLTEPYVDNGRLGAIGASFGGYTVYWLMGHHQDRFQCMVAHAGVFNLESMYGSTEEIWFPEWDLQGPYWRNDSVKAKYDRFSPHRFVGNWRTPLLVVHGEKDFRVPITQGMEAFTAAQLNGVPSQFLYYPGEGHWVMSPQNGVLWHRVFFQWLDQFCHPEQAGGK